MAKHLSHQHAVNAIRLLYEKFDFDMSEGVPGKCIGEELAVNITGAPYAALYAFVDEMIVLLRGQSAFFLAANHNDSASAISFYRLSVKQIHTLTSIRALCGYGLDTNGRLHLRLLYETSLLWVRFRIDPQCMAEYVSCTSPESANSFWHRYISKGKTEKYLKKELSKKGISWIGSMKNAIEDMKQKISLVAHPTFLSDYHETLFDLENLTATCVIKQPSSHSYTTLSYAILITAIPFSIFPDPGYDFETISLRNSMKKSWNPIPHPTSSWEEYNQKLRNMFPAIFMLALRFFDEFDKERVEHRGH